jgi:hypothetical protein
MHIEISVLEENDAFIFRIDPERGSAFYQNIDIHI